MFLSNFAKVSYCFDLMSVKQLYFTAAILFLAASWFSIGFRHGDEHYQIFEFAQCYLGKRTASQMPWEYYTMMRPTLQPMLTAAGIISFHFFGIHDPFLIAFIFKLFSACTLFFAIRFFLQSFDIQNNRWAVFLSYFLCVIPYIGARYSSEGLATSMLLFTLSFLIQAKQVKHFFIAGLFAGLAFAFRYQIAFALAGTGIWLLLSEKNSWKAVSSYILGFVLVTIFAGIGDCFFYGQWTFPPYNYFYQNIVLNKASNFGTDPWYYYFVKFLELTLFLPGLFVLFAVLWFSYQYPKHILTLSGWFFVIGHIAVAHKETRFLYPIMTFLPLILFYFYQQFQFKWVSYFLYITVFINCIFIFPYVFLPASGEIFIMKYLEKDFPHTRFKLFYEDQNNPYDDYGVPNSFYARKQVIAVDQKNFNPQEENDTIPSVWLSNQCNLDGKIIGNYILIRKTQMYPDFIIEHFNFNNWINRTGILTVYELKKRPLQHSIKKIPKLLSNSVPALVKM
jgi:phosphatidylinositol glycan class B